MNTLARFVVLAVSLFTMTGETLQAQPGARRGPEVVSPEVYPDGRVAFRLVAPQAESVGLTSPDLGGTGPLSKNDDGVWELVHGPIDPSRVVRYQFDVDGLRVADPVNRDTSEANGTVFSTVFVPGLALMEVQDVPHGAVAEVTYHSRALGRVRRMHVYTPPGYELSGEKYPVLYLLHGASDSDDSWTTAGRANFILDNLIAQGRAVPMVVVMPDGHTSRMGRGRGGRGMQDFVNEFTQDIVPTVEKTYRLHSGRSHRAIAGLSMGGAQTLSIISENLGDYGYVGVFSSGVFGINREQGDGPTWEQEHLAALENPQLKKGLELFWFATGRDDFLLDVSRETVALFEKHEFDVTYEETAGGHTWINWRDYLQQFAPMLFQAARGDSSKPVSDAADASRDGERVLEYERPVIGADISFVPSQEARGTKFSDEGVEKDVLEILADHEFNWIRLRLFVDPTAENGYSRDGYCGLEQTLAMAKRIEDAGMNFLLDLHYSDTWADPGKQFTPAAWRELNDEELADKVYEYTNRVVKRFMAEGVAPEMVQIGNEIHNGFLWPRGRLKDSPDTFGTLLRRASEGVRDADPKIKVMVHPALGGDNGRSVRFFDLVLEHDVVFDVIGQSYYPQHHGTLDDLKKNLTDLATRYRRPIVVVEYQEHRREVNEIVADLPDGLGWGTFIWEATSSRWGGLFERDGGTSEKIDLYPAFLESFDSKRPQEPGDANPGTVGATPDDEPSAIKVVRDIAYREGDSQAWRLDLAMPTERTKEPRPALVIVHGGGWRAGSKSVDVFQKMMTDYAKQGYVTVNVEYRLTGEAPFPACIEDVKCAVRWLRAHAEEHHVDPDRIGAYGHSAGAHLALMLAMVPKSAGLEGDGGWDEYSSLVNAAAAGSPPTELGRDVPMAKPEWWPIGYIAADHPPLFLIQGSDDRIVRAALTDDFVEKMKAKGAPVEYLRIDGAGHGVAYGEHLDVTDAAIEKFLDEHLRERAPRERTQSSGSRETAIVVVEDGGKGAHPAVVTEDPTLPGMTIYRPRDLSPFGADRKLPVVLWGNGACANTTQEHKNFLNEIASHGYVVLAIGLLDQIENRDETSRRTTRSRQLLSALDWILAESKSTESDYFGKVDVANVAAMGMSCGGLQAIEISTDRRITTTVVCNSGVLPTPSRMPAMPALVKDDLKGLHAPVLYIMGGRRDIAYENAKDDFVRIDHIPIAMTNFDVGHAGTYARPHGGAFTRVALTWLEWQLKGHADASKLFLGENSGLARDPDWTIEVKNFDPRGTSPIPSSASPDE